MLSPSSYLLSAIESIDVCFIQWQASDGWMGTYQNKHRVSEWNKGYVAWIVRRAGYYFGQQGTQITQRPFIMILHM